MPRIFISYRRDDSQEITGRIYDRLAAEFAAADIFRDVDSIPPGVDFRKILEREIAKCDIVLAVVGPRWLTSRDREGQRRLERESDFVRIELESALERQIRVIPVLVSNAAMPVEADLPRPLAEFAFRNARAVRPDPDFTGTWTS